MYPSRRHVPWDPLKDAKELQRAHNGYRGGRATDDGNVMKLDPLGVLIMGEMPNVGNNKIIPL